MASETQAFPSRPTAAPNTAVGVASRDADEDGQSVCLLSALTWAESVTTPVASIMPAPSSRCTTAACGHSTHRLWTRSGAGGGRVDFETPNHGGSARQAQPLTTRCAERLLAGAAFILLPGHLGLDPRTRGQPVVVRSIARGRTRPVM